MLFQGKKYNIGELIDTLVEMAQLARQNGLLALEEKANEIDVIRIFDSGISSMHSIWASLITIFPLFNFVSMIISSP